MKFNYQARTSKGEVRIGQIEASSKTAAISFLQRNNLFVTFLEEAAAPFYAKKVELLGGISRKDIVLFSRQLSIMFRSKVPLVESLQTLSTQTANPTFKENILKMSEEIEGGASFSQALSLYPKIFSSFFIAMVKSGEVSGKLSEVLNYLADHLEREYHLAAKTRGALLYPALIVVVVILVLLLMIFFVIPQLAEVLETGNQPLPVPTRFIINLAEFLRNWGLLLLVLLAFLVFSLFRYQATQKGKNAFDKLFLRLPMIGPLLKMIYLSRFAENLSTLISGGLPIAQSLETVADIIGNNSYRSLISQVRDKVKRGEAISSVLSQAPELFPPVFVQMVLVGEKTGSLDTSLMNIVSFYQKEIDRTIDNVLSILEPVLILILGLIVAGIMLSILMPLYRTIAI